VIRKFDWISVSVHHLVLLINDSSTKGAINLHWQAGRPSPYIFFFLKIKRKSFRWAEESKKLLRNISNNLNLFLMAFIIHNNGSPWAAYTKRNQREPRFLSVGAQRKPGCCFQESFSTRWQLAQQTVVMLPR
jgi:hypothetical protein